MVFKVSDIQNINVLKDLVQNFNKKLNDPVTLQKIEQDLEAITSETFQSSVSVSLYSSVDYFFNLSVALEKDPCNLVTCLNEYFVRSDNCKDGKNICEHFCYRSAEEYCKNGGTCLVNKDYKPLCE